MPIAKNRAFKEFTLLEETIQKNTVYIISKFNGPLEQLATECSRCAGVEIHRRSIESIRDGSNEWRKLTWLSLWRFARVTPQEFMFGDIEANDKVLGRER